MDYVTLLDDKRSATDLEDSTLYSGLERLFDIFGCKGSNDKENKNKSNENMPNEDEKEIINMMYSLEVIQTDAEDFLSLYGDPENMDEDKLTRIKRIMKTSICETLTNIFYRNLTSQIKKGNLSMTDVYYLIAVFEADVDKHIDFIDTDKERYRINKGFMRRYIEVQDRFFTMLSKGSKKSSKTIRNEFDKFALRDIDRHPEYKFTKLDTDKRSFVEKLYDEYSGSDASKHIRARYEG